MNLPLYPTLAWCPLPYFSLPYPSQPDSPPPGRPQRQHSHTRSFFPGHINLAVLTERTGKLGLSTSSLHSLHLVSSTLHSTPLLASQLAPLLHPYPFLLHLPYSYHLPPLTLYQPHHLSSPHTFVTVPPIFLQFSEWNEFKEKIQLAISKVIPFRVHIIIRVANIP